MKEGEKWKAAFQTNWGLYKPLVMFFGLTNSPATFQTIMDTIFEDLISEGVVEVYLDDILIFTKMLEEHQKVVWRVLETLQQHKLSLKPEKCKFKKSSVEYLGVVISHNSVNMDLVKVARVSEWPTPTNRKEVQSFLGFVNFYRRFIEGFSHIAQPLFDLTKTETVFKWTEEENSAFNTLRTWTILTPILTLPDSSKPYRVEADSLDFATRAISSQHNLEDDKWHPVAFLSKSLSPVERNYEIHDKEMLAIIWALEEWRDFLEGAEHQVGIWTDHKNLEYFMSAKKLNWRQARWSLLLARFDFLLHHQPGKTMGKSDTLSRQLDHGSRSDGNQNLTLLTPDLFAIRALEGLQIVGGEKDILKEIRCGWKTLELASRNYWWLQMSRYMSPPAICVSRLSPFVNRHPDNYTLSQFLMHLGIPLALTL